MYCATLAAVSCEVLNVEPIGLITTAGAASFPAGTSSASFLIKQCRNQNFETRLVSIVNEMPSYFTPFAENNSNNGYGGGIFIASVGNNGGYWTPMSAVQTTPNGLFQGRTTNANTGYANVDLAISCF